MFNLTPTVDEVRRSVQAERLRDIADLVEEGRAENVIVVSDNPNQTITIDSIASNKTMLVGMLQTAMIKLVHN